MPDVSGVNIGLEARKVLTTVFFSVALTALANGMSRVETYSWEVAFFIVFLFTFRTNIFLDDLKYGLKSDGLGVTYKPRDYVIGFVAWFLWVLASYRLGNLIIAARWTIASICVMTVIACLLKECRWVTYNLVYILLLLPVAFNWHPAIFCFLLAGLSIIEFCVEKKFDVFEL